MPISHVGIVSIHVGNLDSAIEFYTQKLGFQKTTDAPDPCAGGDPCAGSPRGADDDGGGGAGRGFVLS